jgi:hypothetical protein
MEPAVLASLHASVDWIDFLAREEFMPETFPKPLPFCSVMKIERSTWRLCAGRSSFARIKRGCKLWRVVRGVG